MARKALRILLGALAAGAIVIFAAPASAVHYTSGFEPLSFFGTGLFQFDDSCLTANGGNGTYTGAQCNVSLLSVTASLNNTDPPVGTGQLDFAPVLPDSGDIIDIIISNGTLVGVNTDPIGFVFPSPCTGDVCGTPWWIEWDSFSDPVNQVLLFTGSCDGEECFRNELPSGSTFNVTFNRVPEPGTLGLIIGGVGAAWVARRRKRAA